MALGGVLRQRSVRLLAVGVLAAVVGLVAHATGLLGWLQRDTVDARFSLRGTQRPPSDVAVVGIDPESVGHLPRFPFSRTLYVPVLENLHRAGARLLVMDISFDRPTTAAADDALYEAAQRVAPVVFATSEITPDGETEVLGGNANLTSIGDRAGAADLEPDADGVLRHTLAEVRRLPTVAAAVKEDLTGHRVDRKLLAGGWIDFPGPPETVRNLSFAQVMHNHFDAAAVRGKVVVIGATAPELHDQHTTAAGSPMSGPEVQADAIATVLAGFPLRSPAGLVTILLVVLLGLLVPLAGIRIGTLGMCLAGLFTFALWSLSTQLAFDSGTVLDYGDPLLSLVAGTGGAVMLSMWGDDRERRRLRNLFAADADGLVEQVLQEPGARPLEPTAIIAGYRIEGLLGRGGMGIVYRATQLALDRPVALKLIATERAGDPVFRERFVAESRIAASIEHANVIPVYEAGEDDGLLFIAMRLVEGFDLRQLLDRTGPLATERAAMVIMQLGGALDAAHTHGLVHRDVKPANVLLTADQPEHAYLTDFGVAKHVGSLTGITKVGQWVGTLDYLAPEQIRGEGLDARADVYALACLLYECLTGAPPYSRDSEAATMWAHVSAPPPAPSSVRQGLSVEIDAVLARGMAKDPALRFASASELGRACARALGVAIPAHPDPPAPPPGAGAQAEHAGRFTSTVISE